MSVYDELLDLLSDDSGRRRILDFRPSPITQARLSELLDKNRNGTLTRDEEAELDEFEQVEHLVRLLKMRALRKPTA